MTWYVYDVDEGILHKGESLRECRNWLLSTHEGQVISRHRYGPGRYEYAVGISHDDCESVHVVREDRMEKSGFSRFLKD